MSSQSSTATRTDRATPAVGTFIISLDLELFWGMQDVVTREEYGPRILGERVAIPGMLALFEKYDIHATWATVGLLATANRDELDAALPAVRPQYTHGAFSNYAYLERGEVGADEASDPYHYGASLLAQIRTTPGQEIACHTFAHYYCLEEGADLNSFEADLRAWQRVLEGRATLDSIVFPRNQVGPEQLRVCDALGITSYRGTQRHPVYAPVTTHDQYRVTHRLLRLLDSFVNVTGHHTYTRAAARSSLPADLAASRFLRPYVPALAFLEPLKVRRITQGITYAAERGEIFHLWWHPHNFGLHTDRNLATLERILQHVAALRDQGLMTSCTMKEAANET
jgi:peptidoglycan/xylan/chitin deacetylase (PgdA/CDA1 family)